MISDLPVFQIYSAMARHAAETQKVTAENISRAGEPGFKAQEVESFTDFMERASATNDGMSLPTAFRTFEANSPVAPNGNSVDLESEIFKSAAASNQHNLAMTVYSKSMDLLRTAVRRR